MAPEDGAPATRQTLAMRLAERNRQRALRAERLARLRPAPPGSPAGEDAAGADMAGADAAEDADDAAEAALQEFLRALVGERAAPAPDPAPEPGAILHFQRPERADPGERPAAGALTVAPAGGLERLPGAGPGLIWTLQRAGLASLADIAALAPEELAARLGPIGRLVPARTWVETARGAPPPA